MKAIELILDKINERDSAYKQTWKQIPLEDLIAMARVKTYRSSTMLQTGCKEKLLDDLIDGAAYFIFAIERVLEQDEVKITLPEPSDWLEAGNIYYFIDERNDLIYIKHKADPPGFKRRLMYSKVKKLFDSLPERSTVKDLLRQAEEMSFKISDATARYLMHVFSAHFDARLMKAAKRGSEMILVKRYIEPSEIPEPPEPKSEAPAKLNNEEKEEAKEQTKKRGRKPIYDSPDIVWISHRYFQYAIHDNRLLIQITNKEGKRTWSRSYDYEKIKQLFKKLPDEAYAEDVVKAAGELGLNIDRKVASSFLMPIFASYVDFDAELAREGRKLKLVKQTFSLSDDIRMRLKQERELIGNIYDGT